ncbi:SRPBCC family protein [Thermoflexus sp.]|uniref:SRPBCC family protein n=1 Tax=Thermoflexus sp. TaxID=1969742 RepID=UPI0017699E7E|nr:SRPBCC family protein [Thermoflexus sp.]
MKFHHSFDVQAPQEAVIRFHQDPMALERLTPPLLGLRWELREPLAPGSRVRFSFGLGPLRIRWTARHEEVSPEGFVDEQEEGPFARWRHRHRFEAIGPDRTRIVDAIEADLPASPLRRVVAWAIWLGLPLLFAYRAWQTRRALEGNAPCGR